MIKAALGKYVLQQDMLDEATADPKQSSLLSPEKIGSSGFVVTPTTTGNATNVIQEEVVVVDIEDDEEVVGSTANDFLAELKEEVVLQSLLHKRIHEKKE
jgi:hypothetical protein